MNELHIYNQLLNQGDGRALPPVEKWNPPPSGDIDIRVAVDGTWYYQGTPILRPALVRLFASVLWKEGDDYYLVTPVEKWRIRVDDAPLLVTSAEFVSDETGPSISFTTHTGDHFTLDENHPLRVETGVQGEPRPYVRVRRNLEALIHRNVFYLLIDHAVTRMDCERTVLILQSAGREFLLGSIDA